MSSRFLLQDVGHSYRRQGLARVLGGTRDDNNKYRDVGTRMETIVDRATNGTLAVSCFFHCRSLNGSRSFRAGEMNCRILGPPHLSYRNFKQLGLQTSLMCFGGNPAALSFLRRMPERRLEHFMYSVCKTNNIATIRPEARSSKYIIVSKWSTRKTTKLTRMISNVHTVFDTYGIPSRLGRASPKRTSCRLRQAME